MSPESAPAQQSRMEMRQRIRLHLARRHAHRRRLGRRGPPLLRVAHWLSHVELEPDEPGVAAVAERAVARSHLHPLRPARLRLSDSNPRTSRSTPGSPTSRRWSISLGLDRFPLLGMSQGGAVAIAYAVLHPGRSRISFSPAPTRAARCAGPRAMPIAWSRDAGQPDPDRLGPRQRGLPAAVHQPVHPKGTPAQHQWWNELERLTASSVNAARTLAAFHEIDVTDLALKLRLPTLVLHARGDARVPFAEGRFSRADPGRALRAARQRQPRAARERARVAAFPERSARLSPPSSGEAATLPMPPPS